MPAVYLLQSVNLQTDFRCDLDKVPKKYAGLDGTEIAISESQERMAVVVDPKDVAAVPGLCKRRKPRSSRGGSSYREAPRLVLEWRGKDIVNISRAFLDTNGAHQEADVEVEIPERERQLLLSRIQKKLQMLKNDKMAGYHACGS